jgi:hypothetical protein
MIAPSCDTRHCFMKRLILCGAMFLLFCWAHESSAYTQEDCVRCHKEGSTESTLHLSLKGFEASVHGRESIACQDCHAGVMDEEHQTTQGSGVVNCGECHEQENRHGIASQNEKGPECYACHTKHSVLEKGNPASSVNANRLEETCKGCHALECGNIDYLSWLPSLQIASHGKQDFSENYSSTNCIGCHQGMAAHGEKENLNDQNCHRCHLPQSGEAGLWGYAHPKADTSTHSDIFAAAVIYQILLGLVLLGGFGFYIRRFSGKR